MSVKVFCKLADCVNWGNSLCGAEEIRIDREGYCATYEEIPEEGADETDLPEGDDLTWEEEEDEDLEVKELGEGQWEDLDEEEEEEEEDAEPGSERLADDPWSG